MHPAGRKLSAASAWDRTAALHFAATPTRAPLRQPRLQILTHHLIQRTPFWPPPLTYRSQLHSAITACACPRHNCSATQNQVVIGNCSNQAKSSITSPEPASTATRTCVAGEYKPIQTAYLTKKWFAALICIKSCTTSPADHTVGGQAWAVIDWSICPRNSRSLVWGVR